MNVALKEWSVTGRALEEGRQHVLLRKGGIVEHRQGFRVLHPEFLLFPTWEHQHGASLRDEHQDLWRAADPEPDGVIAFRLLVSVEFAVPAPDTLDALTALEPWHVYNEFFLRQRLAYRPDLPLWALAVRAYRLPETVTVPARAAYAGCKSWVHLTEEVDVHGRTPVVDDGTHGAIVEALRARLGVTGRATGS